MYSFLKKGNLAGLQLKNSLVFPALNTNLSNEKGQVTQELLDFYTRVAQAGSGLIIVGPVRVDRETGVFNKKQLEATELSQVEDLRKLSQLAHKEGAKIFLQLQHPGLGDGKNLNDISHRQIQVLISRFSISAKIAQEAGMDGVEIQAGHGHLFSQFISPATNKRTDKYGGNIYNNLNFLKETIQGIQEFCTRDFPIIVKMNAIDFIPGGLELEDAIQAGKIIESLGVHALSISAGNYEVLDKMMEESGGREGWMSPAIREIKSSLGLEILASNNIRSPKLAKKMFKDEEADLLILGRSQLADMDWIKKLQEAREDEIIKCKSCLKCIKNSISGGPIRCFSK